MLLAQQISTHVYSTVFCPTLASFDPDLQFSGYLAAAALGNVVEHNVVESSTLVLDHAALHFHRKIFHAFSMHVCIG